MLSTNWEYSFTPDFPLYIFPFDVKGNRDKMHWHDYYEIGLCTAGVGKFIYVNKEYTAESGDVFISNNFESHVAITDDDSKMQYTFLIFMPAFIANPNGRQMDLNYLLPFSYNPPDFQNKIAAGTPAAKKLSTLIRSAQEIYDSEDTFKKLASDIKLREILLEISRHFDLKENFITENKKYTSFKVQMAIKYMNEHFTKTITIAEIAEFVKLSPSYFRHIFKANTRVTVKEYITYLRMSHAKKLLLATNKAVSEIILDTGYNNMHHFYIVFERYVGMTPTNYRRKYKLITPVPSQPPAD